MSHKKPLIGVTTSAGKDWLLWQCIKLAVTLAGGRAKRITPPFDRKHYLFDGYILSGGTDINPSNYGQENIASRNIDDDRDSMELEVVKHALNNKKSILGICRGAQMINVAKGGGLFQDAGEQHDDFLPTKGLLGKLFFRKSVQLTSKLGKLHKLMNYQHCLAVNSLHHQSIAQLGEGLVATAHDQYGIIQAVEDNGDASHFILGVQWHPELMFYHSSHFKLFKALVASSQ